MDNYTPLDLTAITDRLATVRVVTTLPTRTEVEQQLVGVDIEALIAEVEHLRGLAEAAVEVDYRWHQFTEARTSLDQAGALVELSNHMHDMRTWLEGYEYEHDTLPWQREDDDEN